MQDNATSSPFMFSMGLVGGDLSLNDLNFTAWEVFQSNGNNPSTAVFAPLQLELCTIDHFSQFPEIQGSVNDGMNKWLCLPNNR